MDEQDTLVDQLPTQENEYAVAVNTEADSLDEKQENIKQRRSSSIREQENIERRRSASIREQENTQRRRSDSIKEQETQPSYSLF